MKSTAITPARRAKAARPGRRRQPRDVQPAEVPVVTGDAKRPRSDTPREASDTLDEKLRRMIEAAYT